VLSPPVPIACAPKRSAVAAKDNFDATELKPAGGFYYIVAGNERDIPGRKPDLIMSGAGPGVFAAKLVLLKSWRVNLGEFNILLMTSSKPAGLAALLCF